MNEHLRMYRRKFAEQRGCICFCTLAELIGTRVIAAIFSMHCRLLWDDKKSCKPMCLCSCESVGGCIEKCHDSAPAACCMLRAAVGCALPSALARSYVPGVPGRAFFDAAGALMLTLAGPRWSALPGLVLAECC